LPVKGWHRHDRQFIADFELQGQGPANVDDTHALRDGQVAPPRFVLLCRSHTLRSRARLRLPRPAADGYATLAGGKPCNTSTRRRGPRGVLRFPVFFSPQLSRGIPPSRGPPALQPSTARGLRPGRGPPAPRAAESAAASRFPPRGASRTRLTAAGAHVSRSQGHGVRRAAVRLAPPRRGGLSWTP
jgi:hypothetical protein